MYQKFAEVNMAAIMLSEGVGCLEC